MPAAQRHFMLGSMMFLFALCVACGGGTQKVDGPQATLETRYINNVKIKELSDGEVAYADIDAIHVAPDFKVWINHSYSVSRNPKDVIAQYKVVSVRSAVPIREGYICIRKKDGLLYVIVNNKRTFSRDGTGTSYHKDTFMPVAAIIVKSGQEEYTTHDFDTFFRDGKPINEALVLKVED